MHLDGLIISDLSPHKKSVYMAPHSLPDLHHLSVTQPYILAFLTAPSPQREHIHYHLEGNLASC